MAKTLRRFIEGLAGFFLVFSLFQIGVAIVWSIGSITGSITLALLFAPVLLFLYVGSSIFAIRRPKMFFVFLIFQSIVAFIVFIYINSSVSQTSGGVVFLQDSLESFFSSIGRFDSPLRSTGYLLIAQALAFAPILHFSTLGKQSVKFILYGDNLDAAEPTKKYGIAGWNAPETLFSFKVLSLALIAIEAILVFFSLTLAVLWFYSPERNLEPTIVLLGASFAAIELIRHHLTSNSRT